MDPSTERFLDIATSYNALSFGEFILKSERVSPYFFNAGALNDGAALHVAAIGYAECIVRSGMEFDMLFGPAYKGIPIAATVCECLYSKYGMNVPYAYNRKEEKDHGEGGVLVGAPLKGKVLVLDDVITSGKATREACAIINAVEGAKAVGLAISLDREERGKNSPFSAIHELEVEFGLKVCSIATFSDVIEYCEKRSSYDADEVMAMIAYQKKYKAE